VSRSLLPLATVLTLCSGTAAAQDAPVFRPGQIIVSGGGMLDGGHRVGDLTVTIPRNPSGGTAPFTLLRAESKLGAAAGFDARVAYALTSAFALEVRGAYASPELGVTISQDDEMDGGAFASERVQQFAVDVSAIYQLPIAVSRRARAYAIGGGGYLRQLHEGRLLVDTGQTIHVGGGVQYWLRGAAGRQSLRPARRALGVRGEVRFVRRFGGIDFEERARSFPTVGALVFVAF
jgi:hypothetical protein